jgi:hypothetical protein
MIVKQNELYGDLKFTTTIGLEGKSANHYKTNRKNIENGEEYARLIETPYRDLMLDR